MTEPTDIASATTDDQRTVVLDLTGLKCPLPALCTCKALRTLPAGVSLLVTATDPLAGLDIPNAARKMGARIEVETSDRSDAGRPDGATVWRFTIRIPG